MRLYIYIFLGLVGIFSGAFVMFTLSTLPGMVLISVGETTIELSFWFASVLLVLSFLLIIIFWKSFFWLWNTLGRSVSWIQESREKKVERRTQSGFGYFVEGNWQAAKKELLGVAKDSPKPELHYLAAAKSALELGNQEEGKFLVDQAEKYAKSDSTVLLKAKAKLQLLEGDQKACLHTLDKLSSNDQNNPVALNLRKEALKQLSDWKGLAQLLPKIKNHADLVPKDYLQLEENVYLSLLHSEGNKEKASLEDIASVWEGVPRSVKKNLNVIGLYCTLLHRLGAEEESGKLLVKTLKTQWHKSLVDLYGKLKLSDTQKQMQEAEAWLKTHPKDPYLLQVLGRLAGENSLWGKAKDYFEQSLALSERPEVYAELGALMKQLGENERSANYFEKGLLLKS